VVSRTFRSINTSSGRVARNRGILLKEHTLVMSFIFLVLPLFDMMTGFLVVQGFMAQGSVGSPSQMGRFLATLILLYVNSRTRIPAIWLIIFAWLILVETVAGLQHNQISGVLLGYVAISKFLYMYLLFVTLVRYVHHHGAPLIKYLKFNLNFINCSIVFAFATGLANSTYGAGFGTKGFFASGNNLGVYVGVATLVLLAMRRYRYYDTVGTPTFVLSLMSLVLLGTKTSFLMALTVFCLVLWQSRMRVLIIPMFVSAIVYAWDAIVYQSTIFFDIIIMRYKNNSSLIEYLFSNRNNYVSGAFADVYQQDIGVLRWVTGAGSFVSFQDPAWVAFFDTLETDLFDILFMYGMIGLIGYLMLLAYGIKLHLRHPHLLLSIGLLSLHSIIAGHVLFNGMGSTLLIVVIVIGTLLKPNGVDEPRTQPIPNGDRL